MSWLDPDNEIVRLLDEYLPNSERNMLGGRVTLRDLVNWGLGETPEEIAMSVTPAKVLSLPAKASMKYAPLVMGALKEIRDPITKSLRGLKVGISPTPSEAKHLWDTRVDYELRGLKKKGGDESLLWDAYFATHGDVAKELGRDISQYERHYLDSEKQLEEFIYGKTPDWKKKDMSMSKHRVNKNVERYDIDESDIDMVKALYEATKGK